MYAVLSNISDPWAGRLIISRTKQERASIETLMGGDKVSNHTGSEGTWSLIHSWWKESIESPLTSDHIAEDFIPTRLIDVGSSESLPVPRLVVCNQRGGNLRFMTLSYRWPVGSQAQSLVTLTKASLDRFKEQLPLSSLLVTFQEAFQVTRKLGIKYLWIDALCILQDDSLDWSRESFNMGRIYKNAICNIAAGGDFHPDIGIFRLRDPARVRPLKVDVNWDFEVKVRMFDDYEFLQGPYYILGSRFIQDNILNEPINGRAWVLQERLLSSRILYFGTDQVFWKDIAGFKCESFPLGIPKSRNAYRSQTNEVNPEGRYLGSYPYDYFRNPVEQREKTYEEWDRVINLYSRCDITRASDKLIALSGLARQFEALLEGDKYHAGMWESTLPRSLLWRTKNGRKADGTPSSRLDISTIPSWSWASVKGVIEPEKLRYRDEDSQITILAIIKAPTSINDSQGAVDCPRIRLRGRLLSMEYARWNEWRDDDWNLYHKSQVVTRIGWIVGPIATCSIDDRERFLSRWDDCILRAIIRSRILFMLLYAIFMMVRGQDLFSIVALTLSNTYLINFLFVQWIGTFLCYKSPDIYLLPVKEDTFNIEGLVLEAGEVAGEYRRIGHFERQYSKEDFLKMFEPIEPEELILI